MNYEQALQAMRERKKVKRKDWGHHYYKIKETIVNHYNSEECYTTTEDILATDWEVVEEESQ